MKLIFIFLLVSVKLFAKAPHVGEVFPYTSFPDQFDKKIDITKDTKKIIISFTKKKGQLVKAYLEKNKDYLSANSAVYLIDISKVPSLARILFMMPILRYSSFSIGVIKEEVKNFPQSKDRITIIELENKIIKSIKFVKNLR